MILWTAFWLAMSVPLAYWLLACYHIGREQKSPADTSNRINKIRLLWYALRHEDDAAQLYRQDDNGEYTLAFHWLRTDEFDNE